MPKVEGRKLSSYAIFTASKCAFFSLTAILSAYGVKPPRGGARHRAALLPYPIARKRQCFLFSLTAILSAYGA